jgi:hypothetical protein
MGMMRPFVAHPGGSAMRLSAIGACVLVVIGR